MDGGSQGQASKTYRYRGKLGNWVHAETNKRVGTNLSKRLDKMFVKLSDSGKIE